MRELGNWLLDHQITAAQKFDRSVIIGHCDYADADAMVFHGHAQQRFRSRLLANASRME